MGCSEGFAGARTRSNERCTRVVRRAIWWDAVGVKCRVTSGKVGLSWVKSGKVGRKIFSLVLVDVTLLHQFLRVWSLFMVLARSLRCSSTTLTDDRFMPVSWWWRAWCRARTVRVGLCRVMSAQVGSERQFSLFWSSALDFEGGRPLSLLGTGRLTFLQGPCFAFRFPASGRRGLMTVRPQQFLFALR